MAPNIAAGVRPPKQNLHTAPLDRFTQGRERVAGWNEFLGDEAVETR
jgi:hypothetical protein